MAWNPRQARDPIGRWTSGGGVARASVRSRAVGGSRLSAWLGRSERAVRPGSSTLAPVRDPASARSRGRLSGRWAREVWAETAEDVALVRRGERGVQVSVGRGLTRRETGTPRAVRAARDAGRQQTRRLARPRVRTVAVERGRMARPLTRS